MKTILSIFAFLLLAISAECQSYNKYFISSYKEPLAKYPYNPAEIIELNNHIYVLLNEEIYELINERLIHRKYIPNARGLFQTLSSDHFYLTIPLFSISDSSYQLVKFDACLNEIYKIKVPNRHAIFKAVDLANGNTLVITYSMSLSVFNQSSIYILSPSGEILTSLMYNYFIQDIDVKPDGSFIAMAGDHRKLDTIKKGVLTLANDLSLKNYVSYPSSLGLNNKYYQIQYFSENKIILSGIVHDTKQLNLLTIDKNYNILDSLHINIASFIISGRWPQYKILKKNNGFYINYYKSLTYCEQLSKPLKSINGFDEILSFIEKGKSHYLLQYPVLKIAKTDSLGQFSRNSTADTILNDYASTILDHNNVAALINSNGSLFTDRNTPQYKSPKNGTASSIFNTSLWMGAKVSNNLYFSGSFYISDYLNGPISNLPKACDALDAWQTIWKLNRQEILSVKNDFEDNGAINKPIPASIRNYPGKGNIMAKGKNGILLDINFDAAPFVDRNNDGIYNPYQGDYPLIKGDVYTWCLMNDRDAVNPLAGSKNLEMEIQQAAWQYACAGDSALSNSTFINYTLTNKSSRDYDSLLLGQFVDFDIARTYDDYFGCIPSKNTAFAYNSDTFEYTLISGNYDRFSPVQTATILNNKLSSFRTFYQTSGIDSFNTVPYVDYEFINLLKGLNKYGINPFTKQPDTPAFMYPDNPIAPNGYSMCRYGFQLLSDLKCVLNTPPRKLLKGANTSFEIAFTTFHYPDQTNCKINTDLFTPKIDSLVKYHVTEKFSCWWDTTLSLVPKPVKSPVAQYSVIAITNQPSMGSVQGGGLFYSGNICDIKATPAPGYSFVGWYTLNNKISDASLYSFPVLNNQFLVAVFDKSSAIETPETNNPAFSFYPNPVNDLLYYSNPGAAPITINIYNQWGQKLNAIKGSGDKGVIDLSSFPNGIYFLEARNNSVNFIQKVIKE